ncbi:secreted RxLR effector protein 161-like [Humulus lupulus]|uniref:secreted RxLR effector protein 161-like n=1 Tax=Humulus lupulus TaxID=3486 RepID=UPI002B4095C1|nr:secreted RxLR effector protein 161-like [Humulus lupulus]
MKGAKYTKQPMANQFQLSKEQCPKTQAEKEAMSHAPYYNAVVTIMYLMVCTRPDLAYAINVLSRYMADPGRQHWEAMKWVFKYLLGIIEVGPRFSKRTDNTMIKGYSDVDYTGDRDTKKSISVYVFLIWGNCISWKVQQQLVVALSITESETKHVEVKYHFIWDKVTQGVVQINKVLIEENPVDMGTKIVTLTKFNHNLNLLGIIDGG